MAGLTLRTTDLARATGVLRAAGVPVAEGTGRVIVPAADAFGATLEFVA